jgi:membrane-associated phospholipid phosphatase
MTCVADLDRQLFRRISEHDAPILDAVMPELSRAADNSRLWLAIAAAMYASGRPALRRAAVTGVASIAVASASTNLLAKSWIRRVRPPLDGVPALRRVVRRPVTTSFPSGHAASAAAFATAAGLACPAVAAPLGALSAAVAFSRIWTGAHYPLDVAAGAAWGSLVARAVSQLL